MIDFNRAQISEAFGVNLTTIDKWRRSGCPATKTSTSVLFRCVQLVIGYGLGIWRAVAR